MHGARGIFRQRRSRFVVDHENFGLEERTILVDADEFEALAAFGDEVEAAVGIFFDDRDDFGGAAYLGEARVEGAHHAEGKLPGEAFPNHFFIARFENVQRQGSAGEQDDIEREQGNQGRHRAISGSGVALFDCTLQALTLLLTMTVDFRDSGE